MYCLSFLSAGQSDGSYPVHTTPKEVENGNLTVKHIKCFHSAPLSTLRRRNLKTQQSAAILNLCLRKTGAEKSRDYRDVIVFVKLRFQNIFVAIPPV